MVHVPGPTALGNHGTKDLGIATETYDKGEGKSVSIAYTTKSLHNVDKADLQEDLMYGTTILEGEQVDQLVNKLKSNTNVPTSRTESVREAMRMYDQYGMVRVMCDSMVNFVATNYTYIIPGEKDKSGRIQKFWDEYYKDLRIRILLKQVALDFFRAGNGIIIPSYASYEPKNNRFIKKDKSSEYYDTHTGLFVTEQHPIFKDWAQREDLWKQQQIPVRFDIIRPDSVTPKKVGINEWQYGISLEKATMEKINNIIKTKQGSYSNPASIGLPPAFAKSLQRSTGKTLVFTPGKDMILLGYKKTDYEPLGLPFWWGAASDIKQKDEQMQTDNEVINSAMQKMWIITIGNDTFPATDAQLQAIGKMFSGDLEQGGTYLWNHTLKVDSMGNEMRTTPRDSYATLDEQIFTNSGYPLVFAAGKSGSNFSVAAYEIIPMIQFCIDSQEVFQEQWLKPFHEEVSRAMGFRTVPEGRFARNALRDMNSMMKNIQAFWDRGIYMVDQLADLLGTTPDAIFEQTRQAAEELSDVPAPGSPYNSPRDKTGKPTGPPKNRPSNDPSPKKITDRPSRVMKQKATVWLEEPTVTAVAQESLEEGIHCQWEQAAQDEPDTAPAKLDRCVSDVTSQMVAKWHKNNPDQEMSDKVKNQLVSRAWAICRSSLKV